MDAVVEHDPGRRMVAVKNVTVNEEYFQGHFPGMPLMPGVMMIESLLQVATLLLRTDPDAGTSRAFLRGVNHAKFRRQVVPGDRIQLDVVLRAAAGPVWPSCAARPGSAPKSSRRPSCWWASRPARRRSTPPPSCTRTPSSARGSVVEPHAVIGAQVRIGRNCRVGASAVIDGDTVVGDASKVYPFASIGLIPQDLKFRGEPTRLVIGRRNVFREFVTVHRGTRGGGGVTSIGNDNVFMAYAHVAHDCHIGDRTIFGNGATLGGHVVVEDEATISAYSGVHQFCRVGRQAFIGGYSVVTKDALPYGKTVGNRARIYGPEHDRPRAPGKLPGDDHPPEARLPLPAAVQVEHEPRRAVHHGGPGRCVPGSGVSRRVHPDLQTRRQPAAPAAARRAGGCRGLAGRVETPRIIPSCASA